MTDKEIIKAFECCVSPGCDNCPYDKYEQLEPCHQILMKDALDLINRQKFQLDNYSHNVRNMSKDFIEQQRVIYRQQAEIERLQRLLQQEYKSTSSLTKKCYKDGIKEFAERLKEFMHTKFKDLDAYEFEYVTENDIDNLVKEMVGEQK